MQRAISFIHLDHISLLYISQKKYIWNSNIYVFPYPFFNVLALNVPFVPTRVHLFLHRMNTLTLTQDKVITICSIEFLYTERWQKNRTGSRLLLRARRAYVQYFSIGHMLLLLNTPVEREREKTTDTPNYTSLSIIVCNFASRAYISSH